LVANAGCDRRTIAVRPCSPFDHAYGRPSAKGAIAETSRRIGVTVPPTDRWKSHGANAAVTDSTALHDPGRGVPSRHELIKIAVSSKAGGSMRRRDFALLLCGAAASTWSLAARAQVGKLPVVAFIHGGSARNLSSFAAGFRKGLSEGGFTEGQNVAVEYHWLDGQEHQLPALLADLVRRQVAVIATPGATEIAVAAKAATKTIPIVFGVGTDPVPLGLVSSFAKPGGNATGVNFLSMDVAAKRLGLMRELLPTARRLAVLINPSNKPSADAYTQTITQSAPALGLQASVFRASTADQIDTVFAGFAQNKPDALFIAGDGFFASRAVQFANLAVRERIPASYSTRPMTEAGLLMSYGTDIVDSFRQVGIYVGTILKGTRPADLPVLQATKYQFVINLRTAKSLSIEVSPMLLARADEVIE
jgi:putative tryptophan/tyrosine transport system substrate-binding protein